MSSAKFAIFYLAMLLMATLTWSKAINDEDVELSNVRDPEVINA